MESISTIAISRSSRDMLKKLGNKGQTYDEIIQDLVGLKRKKEQDSPDREVGSLQSSESRNPPELRTP
jgi:predicted CopG family antitoxin